MIRRFRTPFLVLVVLSLAVAGCGNSGDEDTATATSTTATSDGGGSDQTGGDRDTFVEVDAPGVTDSEIRFGSIATISGNPLGTDIGNAYNQGVEAYFAWRNDEGGVYGRDLVLGETHDDQLASNDVKAQELVSGNQSFGAFVATLLFTGAETLDSNGVPTFGWGIHEEFAGKRNLFGHIAPICTGCAGRQIPYLAAREGATNIGVVAYGTSENSRGCGVGHREAVELYGEEAGGLEVVFFDNNLTFGLPTGIAPQVSDMRRAGVDFIASCLDLNGMQTLGEELRQQGMEDVVMHHPNSYNAPFVEANAELFEGDLVLPQFTPFETEVDSEIQDMFFEWTERTDVTPNELTMIGFLNAHLAFTGLLEAGPDFSRAAVVDAIRGMEDYTADNMVAPIDWNRQLESPRDNPDAGGELQCGVAVRVEGGEFVQASGEPGKPWFCWDREESGLGEPEFIGDFG